MKDFPRLCRTWPCALLVFTGFTGVVRADVTYVLDAGATITPMKGAAITGSPEALTGSFVWPDGHDHTDGQSATFDAVSLNLSSPSFTLTLDKSPQNIFASDTFADGGSNFAEVVDGTGFSQTILWLQTVFGIGSYVGDFRSPTQVIYTDLRISAFLGGGAGGPSEASVTFSATAVPEPAAFSISAIILGGLLLRLRES